MKISMRAFLILPGILICAGLSGSSYGMGPKPPQELDYSAFQGHFQLAPSSDAQCKDLVEIEFLADPAKHSVTMKVSNSSDTPLEFSAINQGRHTFNSCWSDGFLGYSENTGAGTEIISKTVYLNPGLFCEGGSEKEHKSMTIELKGNTVTLDREDTEFERANYHCEFSRK